MLVAKSPSPLCITNKLRLEMICTNCSTQLTTTPLQAAAAVVVVPVPPWPPLTAGVKAATWAESIATRVELLMCGRASLAMAAARDPKAAAPDACATTVS